MGSIWTTGRGDLAARAPVGDRGGRLGGGRWRHHRSLHRLAVVCCGAESGTDRSRAHRCGQYRPIDRKSLRHGLLRPGPVAREVGRRRGRRRRGHAPAGHRLGGKNHRASADPTAIFPAARFFGALPVRNRRMRCRRNSVPARRPGSHRSGSRACPGCPGPCAVPCASMRRRSSIRTTTRADPSASSSAAARWRTSTAP